MQTPLYVGKTAALFDGLNDVAPVADPSRVMDIAPVKEKEEEKSFLDTALDTFGHMIPAVAAYRGVKGVVDAFSEGGWLKSSELFDDGWQFGDVTKTILGTAQDATTNALTGAIDIGEKAVDALAYVAPYIAQGQYYSNGGSFSIQANQAANQAFSTAKAGSEEFIKKDLYDAEAVAKAITSNSVINQFTDIDEEAHSVLDEKADALVQSAGQLAAQYGLQAVGVPWFVTAGVTSFGGEVENALNQGATMEEAGLSAAISAGAEILSEKMFGGDIFTTSAGADIATDVIATQISDKALRALAKAGIDAAGEGFEEVFSQFVSNLGSSLYKEEDLGEILFSEEAIDEYIESAVGGFVLGGGMTGVNVHKANKSGVDYVTGLTKNEQAVVDKVYNDAVAEAEKNGKVSAKQKTEIYDEVIEKLDKGDIDTDVIEEVLGGDSYKAYKDTLDSESSLKEELKTLQEEQKALEEELKPLNKKVWRDMTGEEMDRREDIKARLPEIQTRLGEIDTALNDTNAKAQQNLLKAQLGKSVFDLTKNDKLRESYFEKVRSKQKFTADLSQYTGRAKKVIQQVMESKLADNTNKSHEFWDWAANMAESMDTDITLANDAQILEMVKAEHEADGLEFDASKFNGQRIDGYISKNGIVLNAKSKRALNFVVGHEITHKLEGTKHYAKLQELLFEYAKGEYDSRYSERAGQYKNKYAADEKFKSKVNKEVTADLVGDYIFNDKGFIDHLAKDQNVFQKVWNEIKYMAKIATAGSEQAKQLEKVKREFERAYREAQKAQSGTQFSVSETTDGRLVAVVDSDILSNIDTSSWDKTKKDEARKAASDALKQFSDGIVVDGITHKVNRVSRREYTKSKYSEWLYDHSPDVFADKMRAAEVADDIVVATTGWNRDGGLKHPRTDNFVDFDHGKSLIMSGNTKYTAEVVVGITDAGEAVFYDVVDMTPTTFDIKKEESPATATTQNAIGDIKGDSFTNKVSQAEDSVNRKFSLSDSNGRELSEARAEYFKDSKIRDEDGNLKVMYHGTPNGDFTVFKDGTYFTDNKEYADRYQNPGASSISTGKTASTPKTFEVYLDIKKPFDLNDAEARKIYIEDYIKGGNAMGIDPYLPNSEYAKLKTIDWTEGEDLRDFLIENGYDYDGLVLDEGADGGYGEDVKSRGTSYVVFSPEQVKTVDNKAPTSDPDIRYSISDSDGKRLSKEQQDYFKDSKMRDDNGNLKVMYHGSQDAGFHVFSADMSDDGTSFFFVDRNDVAASYSGTSETYEAKTIRTAEDMNNFLAEIGYDQYEAVEKDGKFELLENGDHVAWSDTAQGIYEEFCWYEGVGEGDANYKVYLNLTNPLEVDAGGRNWNNVSREFSQEIYDAYQTLTDAEKEHLTQLASWEDVSVFRDEILDAVENGSTEDYALSYVSAYNKLGGKDADLGNLFAVASEGFADESIRENAVKRLNTRDYAKKAKAEGYDGVIFKNIVDVGGYGGEYTPSTVAIAFDSNQIKSVANEKPTADPDIRFSLSDAGQAHRNTGGYRYYSHIPGEDIAPVENSAANVQENSVAEFPDDLAPAVDSEDRLASLDDADVPPETDTYYGEEAPVAPGDPFEDRDFKGVGKRDVNAYMYDNPEVKPFFQMQAEAMLGDLRNSTKGEKLYNDELYYATGGEQGWSGVERQTTDDIAYLLDSGYTYAQIEKGLKDIIEDHGAENNAMAKRIEFALNERLMNGYTDINGVEIPANEDYLNVLAQKETAEAINGQIPTYTDADAPMDDIAPVVEQPAEEAYEAIKPKASSEPRMARATAAEQASNSKVAKILFDQKQTPKQKSAWKWAREHIFSRGAVFEDMSLKTGNRELQAKFDNIRRAESAAQHFMGKGKGDAKALVDVRKAVEKAGKTEDFNYYLYHLHNVDRMTLEQRFKDVPNKSVFGDSVDAEVSRKTALGLEVINPEFKQWAEDVYAINKHLRQKMVDEGVISQETADLWQQMYPHYVPISRADAKGLNVNVPLDSKRTGINAPIKKATGGNSDFYNVFDTMGSRIEQTYKAIAKNRFGVELMNTLGTAYESDVADIDTVLDTMDQHEELLQAGKNGESPSFTVFQNGERVKFAITEDMYDAMKPSQFTYTNEALKKINDIRRDILTTYSPTFALTNPIKDVQDVLVNSQHPVRTYATMPEAIYSVLSKNHWYQERMEHGGNQDSYFDGQTKTFKKEGGWFKKAMGFVPSKIQAANEVIEQIPRMAEYIASRKMGRSIDVSMLDAARVTTNFGAPGDLTNMLNRNGFTFLGASVEGFNQQIRNVREAKAEGLKGWAKLAAKYAVAGLPALLLNHALWDDDEEYEELSDYVKQNYYVVAKTEDGKFIRIPKGRALAVIQDAFKQVENLITGEDDVDLESFGQLVINNLAPNNPLENNLIAPIMQAATNKTWYGDDLVPTRLQDVPEAEQFDETTDSISRWLGEATNTSPYKWNYLLDQYTGGVGDMVLPYLTPEADGGGLGAAFRDKFVTDPVLKNQNVTDFYDTVDKLTVNANSVNATDEDILMSKYMSSVSSEMGKLYQQKREIQNSDLSDAEKYAEVRAIQQQIDDLAKEGLATYGNVTIDNGYATVGDLHYRWYEPGEDSDAEPGWQKITDKQLEKQNKVTSALGISGSEYWSNKEEYDFAYDSPAKYAVAKSVGGYSAYKTYSSELYDIKADKDEDGKSINGSRKEKVINYINNLDADYGEKIILFKSEYPADDTYNYEIIEYLNSRNDISYKEMESILKELGFKVDKKGNVTWD